MYDEAEAEDTLVRIYKTLVVIFVGYLVMVVSGFIAKVSEKINNSSTKTTMLLVGNVLKYVAAIAIVLVSLSTSCYLFQWIVKHVSQICFWRGRIYANPNKRIDLLVLVFSHQQLII